MPVPADRDAVTGRAEEIGRWATAIAGMVVELVEHPDAVRITLTASENLALPVEFLLQVHPEDVGRVVGRKQQTLDAMRILMNSWRGLHRRGAYLKIDGHIELVGEGSRVLPFDRDGR